MIDIAWTVKINNMRDYEDYEEYTPNLIWIRLMDVPEYLKEWGFEPDVPPGYWGDWHWEAPNDEYGNPVLTDFEEFGMYGCDRLKAEIVRNEIVRPDK